GVGGTAGFTVIAVLVASATFRALTFNVTVGQKQLFHRIVQLFDFAYGNMTFIAAGFVDPLGEITVFFAVGAVEVIEGHLKTGEIGFVLGFYPVNQLFRSNALFFGTQHNGGAMSIVGANVVTLVATGFLETNPDIRLNIFQHMAHGDGAVGIGKGAGYQNSASVRCGRDNSLRLPKGQAAL